jgi:hypothetical protein
MRKRGITYKEVHATRRVSEEPAGPRIIMIDAQVPVLVSLPLDLLLYLNLEIIAPRGASGLFTLFTKGWR